MFVIYSCYNYYEIQVPIFRVNLLIIIIVWYGMQALQMFHVVIS